MPQKLFCAYFIISIMQDSIREALFSFRDFEREKWKGGIKLTN